jgi:anti-sigma factor RsiW
MKEIITDKHIENLAADYVLDLLPAEKKSSLSKHIARCSECRQLVAEEQRIGALVRSTVDAIGRDQTRLRSLMPPESDRKVGSFYRTPIYRQLAFAAVFLIVFFTGLNVLFNQEMPGYSTPESTAYVVTASHTGTPAIATSSSTPLIRTYEADTRVHIDHYDDEPMVTPAPAPVDVLQ